MRDNVDQWWRSWCGFMEQECKRDSIGDFCTQTIFNIMLRTLFIKKQADREARVGVASGAQASFADGESRFGGGTEQRDDGGDVLRVPGGLPR